MKLSKLAWGYGLIVSTYLAMLLVAETQKGFFEYLPMASAVLPIVMLFAFASFALRYARWFWLLRWAGSEVPVWRGWLAYLSGFAFTATPGKVGELVRIRYFSRLHVDSSRVMSAFVFERMLDLVVVFFLATLWVVDFQVLVVAAAFVVIFLVVVAFFIMRAKLLHGIGIALAANKWPRIGQVICFVVRAMEGCTVWLKPVPLLTSLFFGLGAWCATALAFVYLLSSLQLHVPLMAAFATYPLSMLVGAASMLPGGLGSTEAAIVIQLKFHGVPLATGLFAAVIIRMGTMWFSVFLGFVAMFIYEYKGDEARMEL